MMVKIFMLGVAMLTLVAALRNKLQASFGESASRSTARLWAALQWFYM